MNKSLKANYAFLIELQDQVKSESGPVVVPNGWDYAAASMRKSEKRHKIEFGMVAHSAKGIGQRDKD
ncbi:hypothetical protein D1BOALGB6SA_6998 [Olavius sp. associated proteobacterium Delta 1]|nr:hypothetical protein D1BOALGB6SA_6998 [Olavius sp. associated proteobacterium Delta 1]